MQLPGNGVTGMQFRTPTCGHPLKDLFTVLDPQYTRACQLN